MLKIERYVRPETLEEAYKLLQANNSQILGGMLWLRLQTKRISTAIDLCRLGLDRIEDDGEYIRLGAYVTLRQLETDKAFNALTRGAACDCVKDIIGVQFRNMATLGGSIFSRFGFGDVFTLFMALDAKVCLYKGGIVPISEFAEMGPVRDILTHILVPKKILSCAYISQRNSSADFPVLNTAVACGESEIVCAVGARPARAKVCRLPMPSEGITPQNAATITAKIAEEIEVASNIAASAQYREKILPVIVRRALEKAVRE